MYNIYFDSGTSNTRIYLLRETEVIASKKKNIGSKDSSIRGSNEVLIQGLYSLYQKILQDNQLSDTDIQGIYASGMITSSYGFKEVPHLSTPVSAQKLFQKMYTYFEEKYFQREIYLIRGIKTISSEFRVQPENVHLVNIVRGEEIEIFGILKQLGNKQQEQLYIILPGSHTHIARIKKGVIDDLMSTFSGELFQALKESTILANTIDFSADPEEKMVLKGLNYLQNYGMNRALYAVRTMQVFTEEDSSSLTSFLQGVINGGIVMALKKQLAERWEKTGQIIIPDYHKLGQVFKILLEEVEVDLDIKIISLPSETSFAVRGFKHLIKNLRR